ncbi:recombinase family protein [Burkholderia stagnalis]|uniref:recombinase family protein n=1 Tax=Burkholderia stagnalis TaxID=1503054 RepID=UPI000FB15AC6|nr:recombinase family protein [Burkholderia stagnalis]RQQ21307.1 recombinase family protein [Burkholderia stagnalis]RQY84958.1 recombinase family protein [Burkholderia stagnalis]
MPPAPTPKAYSYIRFSTPEQQSGDSYRRQTELSRKYAETHGLTLDENLTYRDLGVSAFDKSNVISGQLGLFLNAVDSGAVEPGSYLLVESLDRLSRAKITDALEIFMRIINRGIHIVTLADGMEYSKEKANHQFTDLIISIAVMSRAHEESQTKSKRLKEAWRAKRGRIGDTKLTEMAPAWLQLNEDRTAYSLIPDRVELVQRMFEWSKDGIGSETIARRLNQQGLPNWGARSAEQWHASYIKKILDNRSVLGEFQPHTLVNGKRVPEGDPALDYFPRIISDEDFVLAKAARQSRRTNSAGRKGQTFSNLFSGILRCGYCDGSMVYVNKGHDGPRARLLVCARAKAGKGCHYVPWEYPQFERSVLTYCKGLDFDAFLETRDTVKSELTALSARIAVLESSITDNEQRQEYLLEAIESGGAKFQQFEARMVQLEKERIKINAELDETRHKYDLRANATVDVTAVRASIDGLLQRIGELEGEELYDMRARLSQHVKRLITRIAMYPGGYIEKSLFVERLRAHLISKGADTKAVDEHIASRLKLTPNVSERFFTMISRSDAVRTIRPDLDNPEILHLQQAEGGLGFAAHAEAIGTILQKLTEIAHIPSGGTA